MAFPHCCAAHGASGGPRAPPESLRLLCFSSKAHVVSRLMQDKSYRIPDVAACPFNKGSSVRILT